MLPLTGLLTILFVGWRMKKTMVDEQMVGNDKALNNALFFLVRYVAPIFVLGVLVFSIDTKYFGGGLAKILNMD